MLGVTAASEAPWRSSGVSGSASTALYARMLPMAAGAVMEASDARYGKATAALRHSTCSVQYMADWALRSAQGKVLELSCGEAALM